MKKTYLVLLLMMMLPLASANNLTNPVSMETNQENFIEYLGDNLSIVTYDENNFQRGLNLMALAEGDDSGIVGRHLVVADMEGNMVWDQTISGVPAYPQLINDTTVMLIQNRNPAFWNFETNTTEYFDFTRSFHHDLRYNAENDTFMVLERITSPIMNQTGEYEEMQTDRITHYNSDGSIIKEWYLKNHTDFSVYWDILSRRGVSEIDTNRRGLDPTHANSLYWDKQLNHAYLNVRNFNQVYEVDMTTGELVYIYGYDGNFTMYDVNGDQKESLWFGSHDFTKISDDEFLLFDNGWQNFTDSADDYTTNGSDIVHFRVDYENMEIHEVFRYQSSIEYHSPIWGSAQMLDNGNYLAGYGSFFKGASRNNPSHTDFGGVAMEITPSGEVVWEMQSPINWGWYRIHRIIPVLEIGTANTHDIADSATTEVEWEDAYSNFPDHYEIFVEDELKINETWDGGQISTTFGSDGLEEGDYNAELIIYDAAGNSLSQTISFTISGFGGNVDPAPGWYLHLSLLTIVLLAVYRERNLR